MKAFVIEKDKIKHNINTVKEKISVPLVGVIKGDGYGMGLAFMAQMLKECGIAHFAVTEPQDALLLRQEGFSEEEILLMRSTCVEEDLQTIVDTHATATVGSLESARLLNIVAKKNNTVLSAHIKIDTGMGRYGFLESELDKVKSVFTDYENIKVTGIYSHLCCAYCSDKKTYKQFAIFKNVVEKLKAAGFDTGLVHLANSAALFRYKDMSLGGVRIGYALIGRVLNAKNTGLLPTGYLQCEIADIKWLPKGHTLGYGSGFTTKRPTQIAIIPVGVKDGFLVGKQRDTYRFRDYILYILSESKKFFTKSKIGVTVNGKKAYVLGHIGQGHTVIDITGMDVKAGDMAIFDINSIFVNPTIPRVYV